MLVRFTKQKKSLLTLNQPTKTTQPTDIMTMSLFHDNVLNALEYGQDNYFSILSAIFWSFALFLAFIYLKKYCLNSIRDLSVFIFGYSSNSIINMWKNECERCKMYFANKTLINHQHNVTIYREKQKHYSVPIQTYRVFKKCNFSVNEFYWSIKNNDKCFYYTSTDNEEETLKNILRQTKLTSRIVDEYFECCLVSYLLNEDTAQLGVLGINRKEVKWLDSKITIKTQDCFPKNDTKTPDVYIRLDEERVVIIDAYNGSSKKEIKKKLTTYAEAFPLIKTVTVYVFASSTSALEQFVAERQPSFKLYALKNGEVDEVEEIDIDSKFTIKIADLNTKYFEEYQVFCSEVFYWQSCNSQNRIVTSR